MSQLARAMGLGILAIALVVGVGISGDTKKDKDKDSGKITHRTPTGWKVLKLSAEQKKKIYAIQDDFGVKINELKKKITDLETQELTEMVKLLTDEQKATLLKSVTGEEKDKGPSKDKDKEKDKDKDKDKKDAKDK